MFPKARTRSHLPLPPAPVVEVATQAALTAAHALRP